MCLIRLESQGKAEPLERPGTPILPSEDKVGEPARAAEFDRIGKELGQGAISIRPVKVVGVDRGEGGCGLIASATDRVTGAEGAWCEPWHPIA